MKVTEITEAALPAIISTSSKKVLVDIYATWCEPCTLMRPVLDAVAAETDDCEFYTLNLDEAPDFAEQYNIELVPTFLIFSEGALVDRLVGPKTKSALLSALTKQ